MSNFRSSFRCGLFFPDPRNSSAQAKPVAPLLIMESAFAAEECPTGDMDRYSQFCDSFVGHPLCSASCLIILSDEATLQCSQTEGQELI